MCKIEKSIRLYLKMKSILLKLRNLLPYLVLVTVYFLFVNIEARKDEGKSQTEINNSEIKLKNEKKKNSNIINQKISIPVIPFSQ